MTEIFSAKSVDDAKAMAAEKFNADVSEITFTVIEEPKKNLFGKLKSEAKVQADYTPPTKAQIAQKYISSILEKMGIDSSSEIQESENGAVITFNGDSSGAIIGRRGETLDALQYLASMICNKGGKEYYRITLDSCGYREKRKQTLEELAVKIAKSAVKTGRSTALEPMNPYERRIIHSAVSQVEGAVSRSVGEEPHRKVIISSTVKPKRKRNNNRSYNSKPPRSLDLKTSFEKDYKKPKPEDNLHAGLYGKIEF